MVQDITGSFSRTIETSYRISYTQPDAHQSGGWCVFAPGYGLRCNFQTKEDAFADVSNYFHSTSWK